MTVPNPVTADGAGSTLLQAERRQWPRLSTADHGGLIPVDLGDGVGIVLDISAGGLLVHSLDRLSPGSPLRVKLWMPESTERLIASARVVWTGGDGRVGLKLLDRAADWSEKIAALLGPELPLENAPATMSSSDFNTATSGASMIATEEPAPVADSNRESVEDDFEVYVEQAMSISDAEGAALALDCGDGVYCVASAGRAPAVGTRMSPVSGVSGECYRTAKAVHCDDAEHDQRISAEAARQLNLRSIAAVPVLREGKAIGVLQVLSSRPGAFAAVHFELLEYIAAQAVRKAQGGKPEQHESDIAAAQSNAPTPAVEMKSECLEAPAAVPEREDDQPRVELAPQVAEAVEAPPDPEPRPAETVRPTSIPTNVPRAFHVEPVRASDAPISAPTFASLSTEEPNQVWLWTIAVLLVLALVAVLAWYLV